MRPCDCESQHDIDTKLNECGIRFNDEGITINGSASVLLTIEPATLRISKKRFKVFSEWFLKDQEKENDKTVVDKKLIDASSSCNSCGHSYSVHCNEQTCIVGSCECEQFEEKDRS